ncbi:hypothetical protein ACOSQ2_012598 [Xanthoceras sorbifolium]
MAMSRFQVLKDLEEETDGTSKGFKAGSTTKNPNVKHKAILKDNTNIHEDSNTNKDSTDNHKGNGNIDRGKHSMKKDTVSGTILL